MEAAVALAAKIPPEVRGAALVADAFKGRAHAALRATIDGEAGAVWVAGNQVRTAFLLTVEHGKIAGIELFMDPVHLAALDVKIES
jgi:RNA polymerase sigma-70 factor (ECF subfamily)